MAVTDSAPGIARMRDPSPDADSGRGLLIVDRLASSWGVDYLARGKRVWAEIAVPLSAGKPVFLNVHPQELHEAWIVRPILLETW